jgi:hypothetical protein
VLAAWLVGVGIGAVGEGTARAGRLWLYRRPLYPFVNVVVMFGLVMGGLSLLVPHLGTAIVFLLGLTIGYAYEWMNFVALDWWSFPQDRFLVFRGRQGCALSVAMLWGTVPVMNDLLRRAVFGGS